MKVFKFGGASVRSAVAVRNMSAILENYQAEPLVVIVSAMGKTTNALEGIVAAWHASGDWGNPYRALRDYHMGIAEDLFGKGTAQSKEVASDLDELRQMLEEEPPADFNRAYDGVVGMGEVFSTRIVAHYLEGMGLEAQWMDARELVVTDELFREANIDWTETIDRIRRAIRPLVRKGRGIALTQGFIGRSARGVPTTLGREGSDFTAAIFAHALDASEVTIWKDVQGLLNADPKYFSDTTLLEAISFREAIELSYYGATIIHPKTIKPLRNKDIPLFVRSFEDPGARGSVIRRDEGSDHLVPSFIFKVDQVLMTLSPRDFSMIDEQVLSNILMAFAEEHIKLNLMQNSAITLSACFDFREDKFNRILERLSGEFAIRYNAGLELITIRHYSPAIIERITAGKEILIEQRSRVTAQFVAKPL